jgi:hypothetical protein
MNRDIEYEKNNTIKNCEYIGDDKVGIKCKNYELCDTVLPEWWYDCKGNYLCTNCHMLFGTWGTQTGKGELDKFDNKECPICLEVKRCVIQPNCNHTLCIECFKRCYFGYNDEENEPIFPYSSEIEDEYYENQEDPKWDIDYPLIKIYNEEWNAWDDKNIENYDDEDYSKKCPICEI